MSELLHNESSNGAEQTPSEFLRQAVASLIQRDAEFICRATVDDNTLEVVRFATDDLDKLPTIAYRAAPQGAHNDSDFVYGMATTENIAKTKHHVYDMQEVTTIHRLHSVSPGDNRIHIIESGHTIGEYKKDIPDSSNTRSAQKHIEDLHKDASKIQGLEAETLPGLTLAIKRIVKLK